MTAPEHHNQKMILCRIVEPNTMLTGVEFYLCTHDKCGRIADIEGRLMEVEE